MKPIAVTDAERAFPAKVAHLMPSNLKEIQDKKQTDPKWSKFISTWFYVGVNVSELVAKPGIDKKLAIRHLGCIMGSYELKHEDKVAAAAWLLGEWFEPLKETKEDSR